MLLAERGLAILLAKVAAAPDAGADPNACDTNDEYDNHDDPLPVIGEPAQGH